MTGTVSHVAPYGADVDLGVPLATLLLVPYIAPIGNPKSYPEDYPKVGDRITAFVRHYGDQVAPTGVGKILLTQDPAPAVPPRPAWVERTPRPG